MREVISNIWDQYNQGFWIVIPTNGSVNAQGECVMGKGLALEAKTKFPKLAKMLGSWIIANDNHVYAVVAYKLFSFPVKHEWNQKADIGLIRYSCRELRQHLLTLAPQVRYPVYLPRVGCGSGKLDWDIVRPVLTEELDDRFVVVSL